MSPVYAIGSNIVSAMGMDVASHWQAAMEGRVGVREHIDPAYSDTAFWASRINPEQWDVIREASEGTVVTLSPFEQMALYSAKAAIRECPQQLDLSQTVFILSTTKGNIEWLHQVPDSRLGLKHSADIIARELGVETKSLVISQACISGVTALTYALRLLQSGRYKNAIVTGADRFSKFVLSGFQSFQAIASGACRPFDAARTGINLGEAAATLILSTEAGDSPLGRLYAGAVSNDANHISGPSRTGEELAMAITTALGEAGITADDIDMISAHGTATIYNDEMESKAFACAGVNHAQVHSFKGYTGHTLGAAGIGESAMILESLKRSTFIPSAGFENLGVTESLNITTETREAPISFVLKTASGFGGCNAAAIWGKASD